MLRFATRWWPHVSTNNLLRWYGESPYTRTFTKMLDLTDSHGVPIVVFYAAGPVLDQLMTGQSDAAVVEAAYQSLVAFTEAVRRGE